MSRIPAQKHDLPHEGLRPLSGRTPRVMILGSFPSRMSLSYQEYYGNPKNRFWQIMEELFAVPADLPYADRIALLTQNGIALWDVIRACERPGSADSQIRHPVPNDIAGFVRTHPSIRLIALNGSTAGRLFHRIAKAQNTPSVTLPSTSTANARVPYAEKVRAWRRIVETV